MSEQQKVGDDALAEIIEEATLLSADYGVEVEEAVRLAADQPLDPVRAERLWTRILTILRSAGRDLTEEQLGSVVEQVHAEVRTIIEDVDRPEPDTPRLELQGKYGVDPYDVVPVPVYNGRQIPMRAGYVDATELSLWKGNHRLELYVAEFVDRYGREPEDFEVLAIMQGELQLPSLEEDPFKIIPLAESVARRGVERPPIITAGGRPKDGNRRIAAARYVVGHPDRYTPEQIERARWIRVWQAPAWTTDEDFEAIVVSQNFEPELKLPWPEYVKARLVSDRYETLREGYRGRFTDATKKKVTEAVAKQFAITSPAVKRYLRMVEWAEDFEEYHVEEKTRERADVRYRANDIFQWFYEIDAGRGNAKLTKRLDGDDELKTIVYDLMFDVLDSGALVRNLHKMVADDDTAELLVRAHERSLGGTDDDRKAALEIVREADAEVRRRNIARRKLGFDQWLRGAVHKLGATTPDEWSKIDTDLLVDLRRVFQAAAGAIEAELDTRHDDETDSVAEVS